MFTALLRSLWNGNRVRPPRTCLYPNRRCYRPALEVLESRALPAPLGGGVMAPPLLHAPAMSHPTAGQLIGRTTPIAVTVAQNTPETVIDLGPVFAAIPGFQHQDGVQLSVLGNTNAVLVRTELSDSALILTYRSGQCGTATVIVCGTDADGVSVQQSLLVTVRPLWPAGAIGARSMPAAPALPPSVGTLR
jgi:hypothetical protein